MEEELKKEIKDLNKRISELERMLSVLIKPLADVRNKTGNYLRLLNILLDNGGLTPDLVVPELKDTISKEIVKTLMKKTDLNISQITEIVRNKRGTASRRIIRERLKKLEDKNIVKKRIKGKINVFCLSPYVIKKWSKLLGLNI